MCACFCACVCTNKVVQATLVRTQSKLSNRSFLCFSPGVSVTGACRAPQAFCYFVLMCCLCACCCILCSPSTSGQLFMQCPHGRWKDLAQAMGVKVLNLCRSARATGRRASKKSCLGFDHLNVKCMGVSFGLFVCVLVHEQGSKASCLVPTALKTRLSNYPCRSLHSLRGVRGSSPSDGTLSAPHVDLHPSSACLCLAAATGC